MRKIKERKRKKEQKKKDKREGRSIRENIQCFAYHIPVQAYLLDLVGLVTSWFLQIITMAFYMLV